LKEIDQERASLPELADRQREILRAVIREFITTAQPVASGALVRRYALPVSSATVRNELAELEELGLLTHPHTSAGRVPTDLGYRYFIESLMPDTALQPEEQLSAEASIVTQPAGTKSALKHVEAVPIHDRRVLIVAVLDGGAVRQQLLDLDQPASADELRALGQRLTDTTHGADAATLAKAVEHEHGAARQIVRALSRLLAETESARASDVYYDGIQNILAQPEFGAGDPARLRDMVALLEDRTRLADLLPPIIGEGEVHVAIGAENRVEPLLDCSLVFGRYGGTSGIVGYVGIVGPRRMDYARSIGAVSFVGRLMSDLVRAVEGN
jgi:heat-inducible transcriptional repressor